MDTRAIVRRQFARLGYDVSRITGEVGEDPYRDMARLVPNSRPVVADVGANIGQTVERMRRALDEPEIHSFEASPTTFVELERQVGSVPESTSSTARSALSQAGWSCMRTRTRT